MPFAVSQWPYSPDPRTAAFAANGWDFGQVPPFSWILATTGATGVFSFFNDGLLLRNVFTSLALSAYAPIVPPPFFITTQLQIDGFQTPQVGPPVHTIRFSFDIFQETTLAYSGLLELLFPVAIAIQTPIAMTEFAPAGGRIVNPMDLTPAKWDVE